MFPALGALAVVSGTRDRPGEAAVAESRRGFVTMSMCSNLDMPAASRSYLGVFLGGGAFLYLAMETPTPQETRHNAEVPPRTGGNMHDQACRQ